MSYQFRGDIVNLFGVVYTVQYDTGLAFELIDNGGEKGSDFADGQSC